MTSRFASPVLLSLALAASSCKSDEPAKPTAPAGQPAAPASPTAPAGNEPSKPSPTPATPASPTPGPVADAPPVAALGDVVATVSLPTGTSITDLGAVIDVFQPGMSALMTGQVGDAIKGAVGVSLDGADLSKPVALLVADPNKHPKPVAALVTVTDQAKLEAAAKGASLEVKVRGGLALVGPAGVVSGVEKLAFDHLASPSQRTELVVYPKPLIAAFRPQIDGGLAMIGATAPAGMGDTFGRVVDFYRGLITATGEQVDRIAVTVVPAESGADLFIHVHPTAGTTLAAFTEGLKPGDHSLLLRLPPFEEPTLMMSGSINLGASRGPLLEAAASAMTMFMGTAVDWKVQIERFADLMDGRIAVLSSMKAGDPTSVRMNALYGTSDAAAARTAMRETMALVAKSKFEFAGMTMSFEFTPDAAQVAGVAVDRYKSTVDLSKMALGVRPPDGSSPTPQENQVAAFDDVIAFAPGSSDAEITAIIDAARGTGAKYKPSGSVAAAMDAATKRGDAWVYHFGLSGLVPIPLPVSSAALALGKDGGAMRVCLSVHK